MGGVVSRWRLGKEGSARISRVVGDTAKGVGLSPTLPFLGGLL